MMHKSSFAFLIGFALTLSANADTIFVDDFQDGSAIDGNPVTWVPFPGYDNGSFTVNIGDYLLVPNTATGPILATAPSLSATDVSIRTQIRVTGSSDGTSLFARFIGGVSTYQGGIATDGDVYIGWNDGSGMYHHLRDINTNLRPNEHDVLLQFDVIGTDLSLYAWPEGQPMPSQPILHASDNLISAAGTVGVLHDPRTLGSARFRFVEVATESIPEPSTLFLMLIGITLIGRRRRSFGAILIVLITLAPAVQAQSFLVDDFNDGNDQGWNRIDFNTNPAWGKGTFDASSGAYRIVSEAPVPTGQRGALLSLWGDSAHPQYADGFVRARMSVSTNTLPWLVLRASPTASSFYLFGIDPSGEPPVFFYNEINNYNIVAGGGFDIPGESFEIGEEWIIEAGAVGNELSMKVWKPGQPEPAAPQWTRIDGTLTAGAFGVGASHYAPQPPAVVSASFDDIYFRVVPEPTSFMLTGLAFATVLFGPLRRKRGVNIA